MNIIQTVTGPVSPDEFGVVSLHEHVYSNRLPDPRLQPGHLRLRRYLN